MQKLCNLGLILGAVCLLTACGGSSGGKSSSSVSSSVSSVSSSSVSSVDSSSSSSAPAQVQLTGLAAIGAPLAEASLTAYCANGSGFVAPVTTDAEGVFTGLVAEGALPCALRALSQDGAIILHSLATAPGRINITPLTDMILAMASGQTPEDWYHSPDWDEVFEVLAESQQGLHTALEGAGFYIPEGAFEPFTVAFTIGDPWDQLLDDIQEVLQLTPSLDDYDDLVAKLAEGEPLPTNTGTRASARACFNPTMGEAGEARTVVYSAISWDSGGELALSETVQQWEGVSPDNPEWRRLSRSSESGDESLQFWSLWLGPRDYTVDAENYTFALNVDKGNTYTKSSADAEWELSVAGYYSYTPGLEWRFDLLAGESYVRSYTYSMHGCWGSECDDVISASDVLEVVTFMGIEAVTVPAGTFDACRFRVSPGDTTPVDLSLSHDIFYAKGSGTEIKAASALGETFSELVSITD